MASLRAPCQSLARSAILEIWACGTGGMARGATPSTGASLLATPAEVLIGALGYTLLSYAAERGLFLRSLG